MDILKTNLKSYHNLYTCKNKNFIDKLSALFLIPFTKEKIVSLINSESFRHGARLPYKEYRKSLTPERSKLIDQISNAVAYVLTDDGQVNGTAFLIAKQFALVPKHCFCFEKSTIVFQACLKIKAETYIDGETDLPTSFRSDFKVLLLETSPNIPPVPLNIEAAVGSGIQLSYLLDGTLCAFTYESGSSIQGYATRSDSINVITINGDSGGPRYSWGNGVNGMHQGQSEALTINQIWHALESINTTSQSADLKARATTVLTAFEKNVKDKTMLKMHFSTVFLHPGQVIPERHGLFQSFPIGNGEAIAPIPKQRIYTIKNFLNDLHNNENKKAAFFAAIPGEVGNIYRIPDHKNKIARIERQAPLQNASNIQIQVGTQTIATVLIDNPLYSWAQNSQNDQQQRIASLMNYVIYQLWRGVSIANKHNNAIVRRISFLNS